MAFDWVAAYNSASPGQTITVPGGTYSGFELPYRAALTGQGSILTPASLVTFDCPDPVTINGEVVISGSCVRIKGRKTNGVYSFKVNGRILTLTQRQDQHPDNVILETLKMSTLGCFSTENAIFRDLDVGPATVTSQGSGCYIKEGTGDENKIGARGFFVPKNILYENVYIHNQNGDIGRELSDCHFGGLFLINADGLTFRRCTFERNVVYHVQIQNFSGPAVTNILFDECSFGATADWAYRGDQPAGQRAIQFDYDPGTQVEIRNCVAANGPDGLYGCYVGDCGGLIGLKTSGNVNLATNMTAPPIPGGTPPPPPVDPPPSKLVLREKLPRTQKSITILWDKPPDTDLAGYNFYKNGAKIGSTTDVSVVSRTFRTYGSGTYRFGIEPFDKAGQKTLSEITITR